MDEQERDRIRGEAERAGADFARLMSNAATALTAFVGGFATEIRNRDRG